MLNRSDLGSSGFFADNLLNAIALLNGCLTWSVYGEVDVLLTVRINVRGPIERRFSTAVALKNTFIII